MELIERFIKLFPTGIDFENNSNKVIKQNKKVIITEKSNNSQNLNIYKPFINEEGTGYDITHDGSYLCYLRNKELYIKAIQKGTTYFPSYIDKERKKELLREFRFKK